MSLSKPPAQRVLVSYAAPPSFVATPNWTKVYASIIGQLPLKNLHWKTSTKGSVKTIQELDVAFVSFELLRDEHTSQVPVTLLEKPLLHIYIAYCEDSDVETYRTTLKKQIKDWHAVVTSKKNQEWLILQIIRPDPHRQSTGTFFQIKGSVLDKLKTDFNSDKRDRCVQVNWVTGNDNPLAWAEFANKLKEGILFSFASAIEQRQEEVKRSENQQSMPGWNFCTFFILKESLASSFEGMNLFEEALVPYDELAALFYRVSKEKNMSWFGTLINSDATDDSTALLSTEKKAYRDLILANTISVFDFSIYLLARQCLLLAKLGRLREVTTKVELFLGVFGKRLRDIESKLPPLFIEAWTYSSALSVVEQLNAWTSVFKLDTSKATSANAGKAELLHMARTQLDVIGMEAGHLPNSPPFSISSAVTQKIEVGTEIKFSNEYLLAAVKNQRAFYELYIALTNRAIDLYAKSGRRKFALKLHGSLAALDLHRGNLQSALATYTSLPAHYAPHAWASLEALMLSRALDTYAQLELPQDGEWIHIVLSFLKAYVEHGAEMLMHGVNKDEYATSLVTSLKSSVDRLEADLIHPEHPAVTIKTSQNAKLANSRDGSSLDVYVTNNLPCVFPVEEIAITVTGRDTEKFRFVADLSEGCPPGKSTYTVFCPTSASGLFTLESSEIRSGKLVLQTNHRRSSLKSATSLSSSLLVRISHDPLALDVRISQSHHIELGKPQSLMVTISSGRNKLNKVIIRPSCPQVTLSCSDASFLDDRETDSLTTTSEQIEFGYVEAESEVTLSIPHPDASALAVMKVNLEVVYVTEDEPSISRTSSFSRILYTALPIVINVEDFFRGKRVVTKFTVASTSHQHVRIAEASLDLPSGGLEGVHIRSAMKVAKAVTVTPAQPANFLFLLDSENGPVRESLTLRVKYRLLREEVESLIQEKVTETLAEWPSKTPHKRMVLVKKLISALESDSAWVDLYGITGELFVPAIQTDDKDISELLTDVKKRLAVHIHPDQPDGVWREVKIPVDVPFMNIVSSACIRVLSTPFEKTPEDGKIPALYAGQPISAMISIHSIFHWGSTPSDSNTDKSYLLRFNIEEMVREWLISGPKRGDFVCKDNDTYTIPITLIPLHHGEFALPRITVTALPMAGAFTMGSMAIPSIETYQAHGAEKVLVLPRGGRSTFVVGMGPG